MLSLSLGPGFTVSGAVISGMNITLFNHVSKALIFVLRLITSFLISSSFSFWSGKIINVAERIHKSESFRTIFLYIFINKNIIKHWNKILKLKGYAEVDAYLMKPSISVFIDLSNRLIKKSTSTCNLINQIILYLIK